MLEIQDVRWLNKKLRPQFKGISIVVFIFNKVVIIYQSHHNGLIICVIKMFIISALNKRYYFKSSKWRPVVRQRRGWSCPTHLTASCWPLMELTSRSGLYQGCGLQSVWKCISLVNILNDTTINLAVIVVDICWIWNK